MREAVIEELRRKAAGLPLQSGVYLMKNADGKIIYVGKSRALKNRVSQYFQDSEKDAKTAAMVSCVRDFDYMLTSSEIEALNLENRLIKLHKPKYNILLKDAKSYPYIKVSLNEEYPRVFITRKRCDDRAAYFGPYSSAALAGNLVQTINRAFMLPVCSKRFPRDIGKTRPCIYSQIGQCSAVCSGKVSKEEYRESFKEIVSFLRGNFSEVKRSLEEKMKFASDNMAYEAAALYRDRIKSLSFLWEKQKIVGAPRDEYDVVALYSDELVSCIAIYYVREGAVIDSDNFIFTGEKLVDRDSVVSFLCDLYMRRDYIPGQIYVGFPIDEEQSALLSSYLGKIANGRRINVKVPVKGIHKKLCEMVYENARIHAGEYNMKAERDSELLIKLASLLALEVVPERIEAVDISNYGADNITAGLVAYSNAKPDKSHYRTYRIRSVSGAPDDYSSMREALCRRLSHADEQPLPDLFLLDGGKGHVSVIKELFREKGVDIPVFGMVKDEHHKTRSLTDGESEISIAREHSVFVFIYGIQEEVHRFTVKTMKNAKSKSLVHSSLEDISGIGKKKAVLLLSEFKTIKRISAASVEELSCINGISRRDAENIVEYFGSQKTGARTPEADKSV